MSDDQTQRVILRLIFCVYGYMMAMASANVIHCEFKDSQSCSQEWAQAFTISSGAATTLWAYITDNPIQSSRKSAESRNLPTGQPDPQTGGATSGASSGTRQRRRQ